MANSSLRQRYQIRTGYEGWVPTTLKEKHELRKLNQLLISEATDKNLESEINYVMKLMKEKSAGFEALPVLQKAYNGFLIKLNEIRTNSSTEDNRVPLVGKFITKIKQSGKSLINAIKGYWVQINEISEFSENLSSFFEDIENFLGSVKIPDDKKDVKLSVIIKNLGKESKKKKTTEGFEVLERLNLILEKKNTEIKNNEMEKKRDRNDRKRGRKGKNNPNEKETPELETKTGNPAETESSEPETKNEFSFDTEIDKALSSFQPLDKPIDSLDNIKFYTENTIEKLSNSLRGFYELAEKSNVKDLSELDSKVLDYVLKNIQKIHTYASKEKVVDKLEPILKLVVEKSRQFETVNQKDLADKFVQEIGQTGTTNLFSFEESIEKKASALFFKGVFEKNHQKQLSKEILNLTFNQLSEVVKKLKGVSDDISSSVNSAASKVEPVATALGSGGDDPKASEKTDKNPESKTEEKPGSDGVNSKEKTEKEGKPPEEKGSPSPGGGGDKGSKVIPIYKKALAKEKYRVEDMDEDEILELGQKLWKKKFGKSGTQILKFLINQGLVNN